MGGFIDLLSSTIILLAGLYLIGLAAAAFAFPGRVRTFLASFASSATAHYLEMAVRLIVGTAFVIRAPRMLFPDGFTGFRWILILTSIVLIVLPWRWHQRFAGMAVPMALRNLKWVALVALLGGVLVLVALAIGPGGWQ